MPCFRLIWIFTRIFFICRADLAIKKFFGSGGHLRPQDDTSTAVAASIHHSGIVQLTGAIVRTMAKIPVLMAMGNFCQTLINAAKSGSGSSVPGV